MRSIRLSLLAYFLVLLALALGVMSFWVYGISEDTLKKEVDARRELLNRKNEGRIKELSDKLDAALLSQARALQRVAFFRPDWLALRRLEALSEILHAAQILHPWTPDLSRMLRTEDGRGSVFEVVAHANVARTRIDESALHADASLAKLEYFQITSDWGEVVAKSPSMGGDSFPMDPVTADARQPWYWSFKEHETKSGVPVRMVTFKFSVGPFRFPRRQAGGFQRGRSLENPLKPPDFPLDPNEHPPVVYIQVASTTTERENALNAIKGEMESELDELRAQSKATLAELRNRLLFMSVGIFAATILGGFLLVQFGLAPLRRLGDAVRRVSAKDFQLPLDERKPMPRELRPIVEHLNETLAMLKRAFAREKQAAADISHELRTPLAALLTTLDLALRKQRTPDEYREFLEDCRLSGQQMHRLVERLLILARLDAGVDTLRAQSVDVGGLSEQCAAVVRPLADAKGLKLRVHRDGPTTMNADPNKLSEVVTNLLHNAIQYNRPDGSVDLTVKRDNGRLCLEVRDTGIGIGPEARLHIFERFYRADPSRAAEGLHAGLGLAIVKGYIDMMGGTISVESAEGVGSTFRVELPAA
jgi:heavy metal sensor kinase